jgi:hypothetical protein
VRTVRVPRSAERGPVGVTVRRLADRLEARLRARGWRWPEASTGLDEAGRLELGAMVSALSRLAATGAGSAELATHPGGPDDPDRARYRWSYRWEDEYAALRSATVRAAVDELGFELGTFADLVGRPV